MLGINHGGARKTALQTMVSEAPSLWSPNYSVTPITALNAMPTSLRSHGRRTPAQGRSRKAATSEGGDVVVIRVGPSTSSPGLDRDRGRPNGRSA
jgi:hypothetical protein